MNAYFQLFSKEDGTYVRLYPSIEGGEGLRYEEIFEYMNSIHMFDYDVKALHSAVLSLREPVEVKLSNSTGIQVTEMMKLNIADDGMKVFARFYAPSDQGKVLTYQDIVNSLIQHGVKIGGKDEVIEAFFQKREYCKTFVIAEGIPVALGRDAVIEYYFNTDLNSKPKQNEDGSVDFNHLDNIAHVKTDQLLAKLIPEDPGRPGMSVYGTVIKPPAYKKLTLKFGKNIRISEDKCSLYATVDGHATIGDGKVFVSNQYEINDVDVSTGDVDYNGNVIVKGNVTSGHTINALGDIEVRGVVEGATLIAGGQIILQRGIQGMSRGVLRAKGNVICKFIESATVSAGGFIQTESILHSKVSAKGDIIVAGKKGYVTGGVVRSASLVSAKIIGSPMGTDTTVEVGVDPNMKENYNSLMKEMQAFEKDLDRMKPVITAYAKKAVQGMKFTKEQVAYIQSLAQQAKETEEKLKGHRELASDLEQIFLHETNARIKVSDQIYPGVKLVISDCMLYIRDTKPHCQFIRENGEVKMTLL